MHSGRIHRKPSPFENALLNRLAFFIESVDFFDGAGSADFFGCHLFEGYVREICGQICADIVDVVELLHSDEAVCPCAGENFVRNEWCFGREA